MQTRLIAGLFMTLTLACLWGCEAGPKPVTPVAYQKPPAQMPSYRQLVEGHNSNVAGMGRVWARANIDVTYRNDDGKTKYESGDESTLMIELPQNVALSFGKFGLGTLMWAGCDDQHFWYFDLVGEKSMLFGSHASLSQVSIRNLPLQIRPADIPMLLGLLPLNPDSPGKVGWERGYFTVEPAGSFVKFLIDPVSRAVRQVMILTSDRYPAVVSTLNNLYTLPLAGSNDSAKLHVSIRIDVPSEGFIMQAKLSKVMDARPGVDRAKDKAFARGFDWHFLADQAFKIPLDKRVDLDKVAHERQ
jgi:hypothetical protein